MRQAVAKPAGICEEPGPERQRWASRSVPDDHVMAVGFGSSACSAVIELPGPGPGPGPELELEPGLVVGPWNDAVLPAVAVAGLAD